MESVIIKTESNLIQEDGGQNVSSSDDENLSAVKKKKEEEDEQKKKRKIKRKSVKKEPEDLVEVKIEHVNVKTEIRSDDEANHGGKKVKKQRDMITGTVKSAANRNMLAHIPELGKAFQEAAQEKMTKVNKLYACKECGLVVYSWKEYKAHMVQHQIETPHKCETCGKCFPRLCDLNLHKRTHDSVKKFSCSHCSKDFTQKINMLRHIATIHTNKRDYKCKLCPAAYVCQYELNKHMRKVHIGPYPFPCLVCAEKFQSRHELESHIALLDHQQGNVLCRYCGTALKSVEERKLHIKELHTNVDKPLECDICGTRDGCEHIRPDDSEDDLEQPGDLDDAYDSSDEDSSDDNLPLMTAIVGKKEQDKIGGKNLVETDSDGKDNLDDMETTNTNICCEIELYDPLKIEKKISETETGENSTNSVIIKDIKKEPVTDDYETGYLPTESEMNANEFETSNDPIEIKTELSENDFTEEVWDNPMYDMGDTINFNLQCAIVNKMNKGKSINEICKQYKMTPEVVNEIWDKRETILAFSTTDRSEHRTMNKDLEKKLADWYHTVKPMGIPITGKVMIEKAEELANESGFISFNGNTKWLERFKKRNNITLRQNTFKRDKSHWEFGGKWKDLFFKDQWPELRGGFTDEDIYTGDEIGIFYNTSRGRIMCRSGKKYIHGHAEDRFSIFMCTNLTGSDKKQLIVAGTDDPLRKSHRNPNTLPVKYIRNNNAHFTTAIFETLVKEWDAKLEIDKRRALLILDRASIHTKMVTLNLKLVFVPWKASTVLMPIKNGISACFRKEFRKLLLLNKAHNVIRGIDRKVTSLEAIHMVSKAWNRVTTDDIVKGFKTTGFEIINAYPTEDETAKAVPDSETEQKNICDWLKDYDVDIFFTDLSKLDMYLTVEDEYLTDQGTHSSVFGGNRRLVEPVFTEDQVERESLPIATEVEDNFEHESAILRERAMEDLDIVKRYLESVNTEYKVFEAMAQVEKFLFKTHLKE